MQTSEVQLLEEIIDLNHTFSEFLYFMKAKMEQIHSKIENSDNTFFIENGDISDKLHELYDTDKIDLLVADIETNTRDIEDVLTQCCKKHNFIDDYIDVGVDIYMKITYCSDCQISKK